MENSISLSYTKEGKSTLLFDKDPIYRNKNLF
ncbi:MAG: hypothetical protein [Siphoviridae sp. cttb18]|nr:MAG: hypothetical protein [Siphoviridae sp. cttb18]